MPILPHNIGTSLGMSAVELIDAVNNELPTDAAPGTVEIMKLLNEGMSEIARRYDIPRKSLLVNPIPFDNTPIDLGSQVSSHKAMNVTDNSLSPSPYQIVNMAEAERIFPYWREHEHNTVNGLYRTMYGVAILQPGNPTSKLIVKPRSQATELYIETSVKPLPLRRFEDYPFMTDAGGGLDSAGAYPELDIAIVYFALFRLLSRASQKANIERKPEAGEAFQGRAQMFYQAYKSVEPDIYEYGSNDVIYPRRRI